MGIYNLSSHKFFKEYRTCLNTGWQPVILQFYTLVNMTHIVSESCIKCRYTDCVDVCPVDCFRQGPNFLVIDPDECIDCAVCIPECPVEAIFAEEDVPEDQKEFIEINAELSKIWPSITRAESALEDADKWADVTEKKQLLER